MADEMSSSSEGSICEHDLLSRKDDAGDLSNPSQRYQPGTKDRVVLKVGERRFETFRTTLTDESTYFAARLSGRWSDSDAVDGSYFIDTDPDMFQHVLAYLRDGTLPLFYNAATGAFEYERYVALLGQARYFGIARLEDWIENERYLAAIETKHISTLVTGENALEEISDRFGVVQGNSKLDFSSAWEMKKVYLCPRGIVVHRGRPGRCGQRCHRAGTGEYEEEQVLKMVVTRHEVIFNPKLCLDGVVKE